MGTEGTEGTEEVKEKRNRCLFGFWFPPEPLSPGTRFVNESFLTSLPPLITRDGYRKKKNPGIPVKRRNRF